MAKFGNENWKPLHVRDSFLFVKGSVKGFETQGSEEGVNAIAGPNSNPGSWPDGPATIAIAQGFGAAAQQGNIRAIDVEELFNFAGSTAITAGKSVVGVRGCISIAAPTTITVGYLYGVQGKVVVQGTLATTGGEYSAGVQGQVDLSVAVGITSPLSALWLDMGATASAAIIAAPTKVNAVVITNTTAAVINALFQATANASYLFDVTDLSAGGAHFYHNSGSGLGSIGTDYLTVLVNGAIRHLALYA